MKDLPTSEKIIFEVEYPPTAQARHRYVNRGKFVQVYDPCAKKKKELLEACMIYAPKTAIEGPLRVDLLFNIERPRSHYRTGKYSHLLKDKYVGTNFHTQKPDIDNLRKFVMDALNGVFWIDDCQICEGDTLKGWASAGSKRCIGMVIKRLNDK